MEQPPERHFGFTCGRCQAANFKGRRYICWLCDGFQLCGRCHDGGYVLELPLHSYLHPLDVRYSRAEYELYFGGESYSINDVPQSYKCALCDERGLTSKLLFKHVSEKHYTHDDFNEYFNILFTRYKPDPVVMPTNLGVIRRNMLSVPMAASPLAHPRVEMPPLRGYRQLRASMLDELRMREPGGSSESQQLRGSFSSRQLGSSMEDSSTRNASAVRPGGLPRLQLTTDNDRRDAIEEAWAAFCTSPGLPDQQNRLSRSERHAFNVVDTVRNIPKIKIRALDVDKKVVEDNGTHKFLCDQFRQMPPMPPTVEQQQRDQIPSALDRAHFVQAILASMLSNEQLDAVNLEPPAVQLQTKIAAEHLSSVKLEPPAVEMQSEAVKPKPQNNLSDDDMIRFFKNLDNYHETFADFEAKKQEAKLMNCEAPSFTDVMIQKELDRDLNIKTHKDANTVEVDAVEDGEGNKLPEKSLGEKVVDGEKEDSEEQHSEEQYSEEQYSRKEDTEEIDENEEGIESDSNDDTDTDDTSDSTLAMLNDIFEAEGY